MIKFDLEKLVKKRVFVSYINSSGNIFYYDSLEKGEKRRMIRSSKSVYLRLRANKISTSYMTPRLSYITMYDGQAISVDPCGIVRFSFDPKSNTLKEKDESKTQELINAWEDYHLSFKERLVATIEKHDEDIEHYYFDGSYFCYVPESIKTAENKKWVCKDKNFFLANIKCLDGDLKPYDRKSFCFTIQNETMEEPVFVFFPTFSTTTSTLRRSRRSDDDENIAEGNESQGLDKINEQYFVNLNFPIDSAKYIGDMFGLDSLEWLNIESILLDVGILNLHQIDKDIRKVNLFNENVKDCLAWLALFIHKADSAPQLSCIRSLYSKLLSPKQHLTSKNILDKMSANTYTPEILSVSDLKEQYKNKQVKFDDFSQVIRQMPENQGVLFR